MIRSSFLAGAGSFLGAGSLGQITSPQITSPYTAMLRFAVVCPLTGPDKAVGQQLVAGVRAAVEYLNNQRSSFDRALLFDSFDDHNTAADATVQSSFATGNPDIWAVIGHVSASATLATLQNYANASMPLIVPTVTDDRLTSQGYRNIFRMPIKDSDEGGLVAEYAIKSGSQAPHVVTQDGDYGPEVAAGFVRRAGSMKLNAQATQFSLDKPDFAKAADAVLSHQPDCVALAGNVDDMGPLMGMLRSKGYTGRFIGTQGFFDATTVTRFAKDAEGLVVSSDVPYYPLAPTTVRYVQDYQSRYGQLAPVAAYGYAAVQMIQLAQRRTSATNRLAMIRALQTGGSYDTMTGSYRFGPVGDVLDPNCYFYTVKDGKFAYQRQAHPSGFMLK